MKNFNNVSVELNHVSTKGAYSHAVVWNIKGDNDKIVSKGAIYIKEKTPVDDIIKALEYCKSKEFTKENKAKENNNAKENKAKENNNAMTLEDINKAVDNGVMTKKKAKELIAKL